MSQTCRAIFGEATSNQGAGRISDQAGPVGEATQRALGELRQSCVRRRGVPDVCRIRFVEGSTIRLDARLRGRTSETYFRTTTTAMTPMPIATIEGNEPGKPIHASAWPDVDRSAGVIQARAEHVKNGRPHKIVLEGELADLIERRWAGRVYSTPSGPGIAKYVFHREGQPIRDPRKAWASACKAAGLVKPKLDRHSGSWKREVATKPAQYRAAPSISAFSDFAQVVDLGRRKRDSVVRSTLILRKLLNLRFAQLAQFAKKHDFGNFDAQTRYRTSPRINLI